MTKAKLFLILLLTGVVTALFPLAAFAEPYGIGIYDANVGYGSPTSLSIATNGNVSIPVSASSSGTLATGTSTVTVTSTDVVGYKLYLRALSSASMSNGVSTLPASGNSSPATLAVDTWGYNTDASTNFTGITLSDVLIKSYSGIAKTGDPTTFTYGVKFDYAKSSGSYNATVLYTAVPQTN